MMYALSCLASDVREDTTLSQQVGLEFEVLDPVNCLVSQVKREGQAAAWNEQMGGKDQVQRCRAQSLKAQDALRPSRAYIYYL